MALLFWECHGHCSRGPPESDLDFRIIVASCQQLGREGSPSWLDYAMGAPSWRDQPVPLVRSTGSHTRGTLEIPPSQFLLSKKAPFSPTPQIRRKLIPTANPQPSPSQLPPRPTNHNPSPPYPKSKRRGRPFMPCNHQKCSILALHLTFPLASHSSRNASSLPIQIPHLNLTCLSLSCSTALHRLYITLPSARFLSA